MSRKSKQDWLATAVTAFAEKGAAGLTIDNLARQLGVTKGSFYHHFQNYHSFKAAFLAAYERESTLNVITPLEAGESALPKLHQLILTVVAFSQKAGINPDNMLRAWAVHEEQVREVQTRVDQQRLDYILSLMDDLIPEKATAVLAAQMFYAILIGTEQIYPPLTGPDLLAQFNELLRLYHIETVQA